MKLIIPVPQENRLDSIIDDVEDDEGTTGLPGTGSKAFTFEGRNFYSRVVNDLRKLSLSEERAEFLSSRNRKNNILESNIHINYYRILD